MARFKLILALSAAIMSAGAAYAQQAPSTPAPGATEPQQMMKGDDAMPMTGMMREMSTMMANCNKMMQSMAAREKQGAPIPTQPPQDNRG